jgi:hypothetical protein
MWGCKFLVEGTYRPSSERYAEDVGFEISSQF